MPRTADEIIEQASAAYNIGRDSTGILTRTDLADFIATIPAETDKKTAIKDFLDKCPFLTTEDKRKTLDDLSSYGI
jgi:hypothetical protein